MSTAAERAAQKIQDAVGKNRKADQQQRELLWLAGIIDAEFVKERQELLRHIQGAQDDLSEIAIHVQDLDSIRINNIVEGRIEVLGNVLKKYQREAV